MTAVWTLLPCKPQKELISVDLLRTEKARGWRHWKSAKSAKNLANRRCPFVFVNFAKKLLLRSGYALQKVAPAVHTLSVEQNASHGWLIEFVGPSGVGKSTLLSQLAPQISEAWYFEHHAKYVSTRFKRLYIYPQTIRIVSNKSQHISKQLKTVSNIFKPFETFSNNFKHRVHHA